jgi:hypothetical protein
MSPKKNLIRQLANVSGVALSLFRPPYGGFVMGFDFLFFVLLLRKIEHREVL